jgi:type IV pilus assembly protein PilZ
MRFKIHRSTGLQGKYLEVDTHDELIFLLDENGTRLRSVAWKEVCETLMAPLSIPVGEKFPEHRNYVRFPISAIVTYHDENKKKYTSVSYDISGGGLFIKTRRPMPIGTKLNIEFALPMLKKKIRAGGLVPWVRNKSEEFAVLPLSKATVQVTYVREHPRKVTLATGMGIKFTQIKEEDRVRIMQFIQSMEEDK